MNLEALKAGGLIPDEIFGWSTKTVLAGILLAIIAKQKLLG